MVSALLFIDRLLKLSIGWSWQECLGNFLVVDIMTAPALPPRNLASPEVTRTRSFTPAALAEHIEQLQFDDRWHPHVLLQYTQIIDRNNVPSERGSVDKENVAPPTVAPREPPSRFICQTCHLWFEIDGVPKGMYGGCSTEGYCTHHYHMLSNTEYQCCGCYYTINVSTENPTIPLKMIQQLASSRALTRTYASMSSSSSQPQPTMVDALALLAVYVRNLIQGVRKSINANNQTFSTRIGLDDSRHVSILDIRNEIRINIVSLLKWEYSAQDRIYAGPRGISLRSATSGQSGSRPGKAGANLCRASGVTLRYQARSG